MSEKPSGGGLRFEEWRIAGIAEAIECDEIERYNSIEEVILAAQVFGMMLWRRDGSLPFDIFLSLLA